MRILVITQYFWPENFKINDVCLGLSERGYQVTVLTGKPNYPGGKFKKGYNFFNKKSENWHNIKIIRTPIIPRGSGGGIWLFFNYLSFAFFASIRILFIKAEFDKIFVYQPSPLTVGIPAIVAKWKFNIPLIFWVNDLWPESLTAGGGVTNKFILKSVDKLARLIYRKSDLILVQSKSFTSYLLYQGACKEKIIYFPQTTESFYKILRKDEKMAGFFPKGFNIVFAGNIGVAQDFDTILATAQKVHAHFPSINWIILGEGRMKQEVSRQVKIMEMGSYFLLLGAYPPEDMPQFFAYADALFISLKKDIIFSLTIPAKIQSYLACGRPIIGAIDGIGRRIIEEATCGVAAPAENVDELVAAIGRLVVKGKSELDQMGANARLYFEQEFERELLLDRLENILA